VNFNKLIHFIRKEVNRGLKKIPLPQNPRYLYDPIRFILDGSGKRFRPILVHLSGRSTKTDPNSLMKIALAVELVHNFTLVHDDIMDNDHMRHGQPTVHSKWDNSTAILAGDGIFAIAQILLCSLPNRANKICQFFNQNTLELCEGQALDKQFENDLNITSEQYLEMVEKKTGALLGACAALPAILNNQEKKTIDQLSEFGKAIGKGFQVHDDLLEIYGDPKKMGKSLGSDIKEGKQTIMVIKARKEFPKEWELIISNYREGDNLSVFRDFFQNNGIKRQTELLAKQYFLYARNSIKNIKISNVNELNNFVDLIEKRTF
jgi:geranylgeranyl diphosphate synthase, type II